MKVLARPERRRDGEVIWYGIFQDVTDRRNYEDTLEQIMFDISHVMRRPTVTMLGLADTIDVDSIDHETLRQLAGFVKEVAKEMDVYTQRLNDAYETKRKGVKG